MILDEVFIRHFHCGMSYTTSHCMLSSVQSLQRQTGQSPRHTHLFFSVTCQKQIGWSSPEKTKGHRCRGTLYQVFPSIESWPWRSAQDCVCFVEHESNPTNVMACHQTSQKIGAIYPCFEDQAIVFMLLWSCLGVKVWVTLLRKTCCPVLAQYEHARIFSWSWS